MKSSSQDDCGKGVRHLLEVPPGEHRLADGDHVLVAGVGAALCVCARDPGTGVGGISHFLLPAEERAPDAWSGTTAARAMRLGNLAVEHLLTDIHKRGGARNRLEVMVFGGAQLHDAMHDVARKSADIIRRYLAIEGLQTVREELGGECARQVVYVPATGCSRVTVAGARRRHEILAWEIEAVRQAAEPLEPLGMVELF